MNDDSRVSLLQPFPLVAARFQTSLKNLKLRKRRRKAVFSGKTPILFGREQLGTAVAMTRFRVTLPESRDA